MNLRDLAEQKGFLIGTCVNLTALEHDPQYAELLVRHFNMLTPENEMKFDTICPFEGDYHFGQMDRLVDFALENQMQIRGHALVWNNQLPGWLLQRKYSRTELIGILTRYIETVVQRYAGKIAVWDVVNEAVNDYGALKKTFWHEHLGPEYIDIAFHTARKADPQAQLFYNDYGAEGTYEHEVGVYQLMRNLTRKGVPIDGVGLQMHLAIENPVNRSSNQVNIERLLDLGLQCDVTELDVRVEKDKQYDSTTLQNQANVYREVIHNHVTLYGGRTLILWGFTDRYSWIPFFYPKEGAATIMTENYRCKPAYDAVLSELEQLTPVIDA